MIGFQNPWALSLLPLAAVPWLLHLLRRRRARVVRFPSLLLFTERRPVVWRRFRLEELLLLAARTLLVAAMVFALARPVVWGWLPGWLSPAEQWAVAIIDDSASMAAEDQQGSAMDRARTRLASLLEGLGPNARVAAIGGGRGAPVLAGFGPARKAIRAIGEAKPRPVGNGLAEALSKADQMLAQAKAPLIYLASDFQASAFGGMGEGRERSGAGIVLIDAGLSPVPANLSWKSVRTSPLRRRIMIEGRWTGQGPARVGVEQGGKIVHRATVHVQEGGYFSLGLELPLGDSVLLRTWDDGLDLDDLYYIAGPLAGGKICLLVAEAEGSDQAALAKGLESLAGAGWGWRRSATPSAEEISKADAIIVAAERLDGQTARSLIEAAGRGRGLVIIPPPQAEAEQYNMLLSGLGSRARLAGLTPPLEHALRLTPGPSALGPEWDARLAGSVLVRRHWKASGVGQSALLIGGHDPGLTLEETSGAPVALWLFGAHPAMSDIIYRAAFPVMLHRSLEHADGWTGRAQHETGDSISLETSLVAELVAPGGEKTPGSSEGRKRSWHLLSPGWYRALGPGGRVTMAANISSGESDLEPMDKKEVVSALGNARWASEHAFSRNAGPGQPAWKALLLLAVLLAAAETALRIRLAEQKSTG